MQLRILVLALALALALVPPGVAAQAPDASGALHLRPGDVVRLQVGGEPEISGDYPVTEEGVALLPVIGLVHVAGRPFSEVRAEVRAGYAREVVNAPVLVTPVLRIAVLGEVQQPGLMPVDPTLTVADVISAAGGLTPLGDPGKVMLVRDNHPTRISLHAGQPGTPATLLPGDQIVVGRRGWLRENLSVVVTAATSILVATITSLVLR